MNAGTVGAPVPPSECPLPGTERCPTCDGLNAEDGVMPVMNPAQMFTHREHWRIDCKRKGKPWERVR
jgi:hypothetical protein